MRLANLRLSQSASAIALLVASTAPVYAAPVSGAPALPVGGSVVSGNATIGTAGTTLTITQTTAKAVINWSSFDVASGDKVVFAQPNAASATLSRVTGATNSTIAGEIDANGSVYLINPNGIDITSTGVVNVGRGFVASTLDITNKAFLSGKGNFSGTGGTVNNAGKITTLTGGYVGLLGGAVINSGLVTAPAGQVAVGAGTQATLDVNGGNFLQVALPGGAVVTANGKTTVLTPAQALSALRAIVNLPAAVNAQSVGGANGDVYLGGKINVDAASGNGGHIDVQGNAVLANAALSARALGASGNGGLVETSGKAINYAGLLVTTSAAHGKTGRWTVDPTDLTIDAAAAATINANLAGTNVSLVTTNDGNPGNGDIIVNSALSWTSANSLTLSAYHSIAVGAGITSTGGGGVAFYADNTGTGSGTVAFTGGAQVSTSGAVSIYYNPSNNPATGTPSVNTTSFAGGGDSFASAITGGATLTQYMLVNNVYDLQNIKNSLGSNYALGTNIDASATSGWNAGAGFVPLGTDGAGTVLNGGNGFTGQFNGQGNVISNLSITGPGANYVGLFGYAGTGSALSNVGLNGGSVAGNSYVGELVGFSQGSITNAFATGAVGGSGWFLGGLVGWNAGSITNAYATGAVTTGAGGGYTGGLVGYNTNLGSIANAYATGAVTTGANSVYTGGLVGVNDGSITNVYSSGAVNPGAANSYYGGLVGLNSLGTITDSYWDSYSSGWGLGTNFGTLTNVSAVTSNPADLVTPSAYAASSYTNFSSQSSWVFFDGQTRPFLAFEVAQPGVNGVTTITNAHQLQLIDSSSAGLSGNYVLANSIDLSQTGAPTLGNAASYAGMWGPSGFVPLGTDGAYAVLNGGNGFTGSLNGQGYTVSNLGINRSTWDIGLFGYTGTGAAISGITLAGGSVSGAGNVGDLVGYNDGSITNASANGTVNGTSSAIGGLVGQNDSTGSITDAYATGTVNAAGSNYVGGLVGLNNFGAITNAYATGTVNDAGGSAVGGLVGINQGGAINTAYATGAVNANGSGSVGGLIGANTTAGSLANAYATGAVSDNGGGNIGGLVGYNDATSTITTTYAAGAVSAVGSASVGGLVGKNVAGGSIASSFWDTQVTGQSAGVGTGSATGTTGLTTAQMTDFGSYASTYAGWDFSNTWSPPSQAGQAGQTAAYYPQLFALSAVVVATPITTSKTYGTANPSSLGSLTAGGPGIYALSTSCCDNLNPASLFTTAAGTLSNVGSYAITGAAGGTVTSTKGVVYREIVPTGSITVNPAQLTAALIGTTTKVYDGTTAATLTAANYQLTGFVGSQGATVTQTAGTYASANAGSPIVVTASLASGNFSANVGTILANYILPTTASGAIGSISKADLTITYNATAASFIYGQTPTGITGTVGTTGLALVDTLAGVTTGTASFTTTATSLSNVGNYAITGGGLSANSGNYNFTFAQGASNATALSITPRALTVAANSGQSSIYGSAIPTLTYTVGATTGTTGLVNGDGLTGALATNATSASNVSNGYSITQGTLAATSNYALGFTGAGYSITPAHITVTALSGTSVYGTVPYNPGLSATGLVLGQSVSVLTGLSNSFGLTQLSGVTGSPYTLTVAGTLTNHNYVVDSTANGSWTITPAALTLTYTANGASRIYGNANPALSGSVSASGLVNGDLLSGVTAGTASFGTTANATTNVGNYAIIGSGITEVSANYTLNSVQASGNATALSITPRSVYVTPNSGQSSVYGMAIAPTYAVGATDANTGLVNGNTLSGALGVSSGKAIPDVGSYNVTLGSLTGGGNYSLGLTSATVGYSVTAAHITVTANGGTSVYGSSPANPGLSVSGMAVGSLVSNATAATQLTGLSNSFGITHLSTVTGSPYTMNVIGTLTNANYVVDHTATGLWTVTPASVTVSYNATPVSRPYDTANPAVTGTVSAAGLVNGDALASIVSGTASWSTPATLTSNAGHYAITGTGLSSIANPNYSVSIVQAAGNATAFTITPLSAIITYYANPVTRIYGTANPAFSGTVAATGLVNGATIATTTTGTARFGTTATAATGVGSYAVTGTGLLGNSVNYTFSFVQAAANATDLTITPRALTLTANALSRTYGSANATTDTVTPTVATATTGLVNGDTVTSETVTTNATQSSSVGSYGLNGSNAVFGVGSAANYTITYAANQYGLTINPAALTLLYTATPVSRLFGSSNPSPLTGTVGATGLVNGDSLATATSGTALWTTPATTNSNVGSYGITGSGLTAQHGNYTITSAQAPGNATALTITAAPVTVTYSAYAAQRTYGVANGSYSGVVTVSGLLNGTYLTSVTTGTVAWTSIATAATGVGKYAINGGGLVGASSNYSFSFVQAPVNATDLTIVPRLLTLLANPLTITKGSAIPTIDTVTDAWPSTGPSSTNGLVNGDTISSETVTSNATSGSAAGSYALNGANALFSVGSAANYTITYAANPYGLTIH
jgi:filamentous hemagglutinin family protein